MLLCASLKRDNKKENDEIKKKKENKEKELKDLLWDNVVYLKLSFLENSIQ